ncbi:hypothetical protein [Syntrophorhabdus aromaticivorans]|jgi:hypothetical protein|uniref:hypothetical protein n=1 Tax=Syntrophorhabdus aromaticivorans TaxID=328301 RepID=UPI000426D848|nr:hypothetical protein [Syntrophorhabdus aromaticivorans]
MLYELQKLKQLIEEMRCRPFSCLRDAEDFRIRAAEGLNLLETIMKKETIRPVGVVPGHFSDRRPDPRADVSFEE